MKWVDLIKIGGNEPFFTTGLLLTANALRVDVEKQLSRWVRSGKLLQLRRGLYALAEPYRKIQAHPFQVANRLREPSYVSLQSALEYYGMIPESVPNVTSVTTGRPERVATPLGTCVFRHLKKSLFSDFASVDLGRGRTAFIAKAEKALLDLIYLTPRADDENWLTELRLQNLDVLDENELERMARVSGSAKLLRAVKAIMKLKRGEDYETL